MSMNLTHPRKVTLELELLDDSVHAVEMNERMQLYCAQAAERFAPGNG